MGTKSAPTETLPLDRMSQKRLLQVLPNSPKVECGSCFRLIAVAEMRDCGHTYVCRQCAAAGSNQPSGNREFTVVDEATSP